MITIKDGIGTVIFPTPGSTDNPDDVRPYNINADWAAGFASWYYMSQFAMELQDDEK